MIFIIQAHNLFSLEVFVYRWDSFPFRVLNEHRYDYPRNKMWSQGKKLWFSKVGQLEIVWHWWSISRNQICIYGFNGASSEVRSFSTLDSTVIIIIIIIIIVSCQLVGSINKFIYCQVKDSRLKRFEFETLFFYLKKRKRKKRILGFFYNFF